MMKYIALGLAVVLFIILVVTRNLDVAVANTSVAAQDTITSTMVDGNGCVVQEEDHEVGDNLMPLQKVTCQQ